MRLAGWLLARWEMATTGGKVHPEGARGWPARWSRDLPSEPSSVTVIRDSAGRYFASFVVETGPAALPEAGPVTGIDLWLKHFAVLSDGRKVPSPWFLRRAEKHLRRAQRDLSRKQEGPATGPRPRSRSRSPAPMRGWPTRGGTFTLNSPRR